MLSSHDLVFSAIATEEANEKAMLDEVPTGSDLPTGQESMHATKQGRDLERATDRPRSWSADRSGSHSFTKGRWDRNYMEGQAHGSRAGGQGGELRSLGGYRSGDQDDLGPAIAGQPSNTLLIVVATSVFGFVVLTANLLVVVCLVRRQRHQRARLRAKLAQTNGFGMASLSGTTQIHSPSKLIPFTANLLSRTISCLANISLVNANANTLTNRRLNSLDQTHFKGVLANDQGNASRL
ncbi:unnamed protein product, partial [Protopolystoma xenopodis]